MNRSTQFAICLIAMAPFLSGCAVESWFRPQLVTGPEIFVGQPSVAEAVDAINSNSGAIRQFYAEGATISVQGFPALKANLAVQRPNQLRMQASVLGIGGPALDVGSNDELFWFWRQPLPTDGNSPQGVFFARHEDAQRMAINQALPIEPRWLIEALGVVTIDPNGGIEGPFPKGQDHFELKTRTRTASGELTRSLVVHNRYGWIVEQTLYDARGDVLAQAKSNRHRYYPDFGVTLPEQVDILLSPGKPQQMSLQIIVGEYVINQLNGDPESMFQMPQIDGFQNINLAQMLQSAPPAGSPIGSNTGALGRSPAPSPFTPPRRRTPTSGMRTGYTPSIRGLERR